MIEFNLFNALFVLYVVYRRRVFLIDVEVIT